MMLLETKANYRQIINPDTKEKTALIAELILICIKSKYRIIATGHSQKEYEAETVRLDLDLDHVEKLIDALNVLKQDLENLEELNE